MKRRWDRHHGSSKIDKSDVETSRQYIDMLTKQTSSSRKPSHDAVELGALGVPDDVLRGYSYDLRLIQSSDIDQIWQCLQEPGNRPVFKNVYHEACDDRNRLLAILADDSQRPGTTTFSVISKCTQTVIGLARIHTVSLELAEIAYFPPGRLQAYTIDIALMLGTIVFEYMKFERFEARTRAQHAEDPHGSNAGIQTFDLSSILRRQHLDLARSQRSDLMVITVRDWPSHKVAYVAWLEAFSVPTGPRDSRTDGPTPQKDHKIRE
ncbi:hypothetical protein LTR86_002752 [Recurvomyces mirabilis]|nr:hypothetical protein LTR86_002752 [Recurvomyces mirabilis]